MNGFDVIVFDTFPFTAKELRRNHFAFFATANGLLVRAGKLTYFKSALRCVRSITNIENSHNVNGPITGEIDALLVGRISSSRLNRTIRALITGCCPDTGCEVGAAWNKTAKKTGNAYIPEILHVDFTKE